MEYFRRSFEISKDVGDVRGIGASYGNLAIIYDMKGDWRKAKEYHKKSLEISIELGDKHGMSQSYGELGGLYNDLGLFDKSMQCHQKELALRCELGDRNGEASALMSMGLVHLGNENWDEALEHLVSSREILEDLGSVLWLGVAYQNIGFLYTQKNEWNEAEMYYSKALGIFTKLESKYDILTTTEKIAIMLIRKGDWTRARESGQEVINGALSLGYHKICSEMSMEMATEAFRRHEYNEASELFVLSSREASKFNRYLYDNITLRIAESIEGLGRKNQQRCCGEYLSYFHRMSLSKDPVPACSSICSNPGLSIVAADFPLSL